MKYRITIDLWHPNLNMTSEKGAKFLKTFFDRLITANMAGCKWWTDVEVLDESERTS